MVLFLRRVACNIAVIRALAGIACDDGFDGRATACLSTKANSSPPRLSLLIDMNLITHTRTHTHTHVRDQEVDHMRSHQNQTSPAYRHQLHYPHRLYLTTAPPGRHKPEAEHPILVREAGKQVLLHLIIYINLVLKETTGGEFWVYRASIRLQKGI